MLSVKPFALLALLLAIFGPLKAAERMRPGLWENTVVANGSSTTRTHCVTPAEAASTNLPDDAMRQSVEKAIAKSGKGSCKLKDLKVDGNTVSQVMVCGATSYANTTIYRGDNFQTLSRSTKAGVTAVTLLKGHRLGACP